MQQQPCSDKLSSDEILYMKQITDALLFSMHKRPTSTPNISGLGASIGMPVAAGVVATITHTVTNNPNTAKRNLCGGI